MPLVPVYSIAKTFTVAGLIASGVDIGRPVGDYVDLPEPYRHHVVRDLMQHTSGLGDYFALVEYREAVTARLPAWSDEELLDRGLSAPAAIAGQFSYSNIGFTLLRKALESITQEEFFSAMTSAVFSPLGMKTAQPLTTLSDWDRCAEASASTRSYDPKWVYPRTFLAEADDVAAGFASLMSGALFDPRMLFDAVTVNAPGHAFTDPRYGLGLMIDGNRWVGHGGGGPGFTLFALARQDGSAAVVEYLASDEDQGDTALISAAVARLTE